VARPRKRSARRHLTPYFWHRRTVDHWAANPLRIGYGGSRCYFVKGLQRAWKLVNFLPVRALSPSFRAKLGAALDAAGLLEASDLAGWTVNWNVKCPSLGEAQASLEYLSREVCKVAIWEGRIFRAEASEGSFCYRQVNRQRARTLAL